MKKNKPHMKWRGKEAKQAAREGMQKALHAGAIMVEGEASVRTPVDTGNLRSSLNHKVEQETARIGTPTEYAPYVEMGTFKMSAQPYLRPALDENISKINKVMGDIIGKEIERL